MNEAKVSGVGIASEQLASLVIKSLDLFLKSFRASVSASAGEVSATMLLNFLNAADRLNHTLSQKLAWLLLEHSPQPDVRGMPEGTLQRLIRSRCFEHCDLILENYVAFLAQLHMDLRSTVEAMTDSRLRNALLGVEMPSIETVKRFKLPTAARAAALLKMLDYLKTLHSLPDVLMDYGLRKLGQPGMDSSESESLVRMVHDALDETHQHALDVLEQHPVIRRKQWEAEFCAENAIIEAVASTAAGKVEKRKSRVGSILLGGLFGIGTWQFGSLAAVEPVFGLAAGICALTMVGCWLWALWKSV